MKIKKLLAAFTIILLGVNSINASATYDTNKAQAYLSAHSDNSWSVMALTVLGQTPASTTFLASVNGTSAIDYETPILAITALGQNPRTFGSKDYISELKSYHVNGQMGDAATLNDDIFGILALVSAGEPLSDASIIDSRDFILAHQNSNGGWAFTASSEPDTNITASAILALLSAGINSTDSHIQNAVTFLKNSQNTDGGFPYASGSLSDSSSTAWVLWALNALNIDPASWDKSGNTPAAYLESNLTDQGFFKYQANSSEDAFSATTTAYAVIALQGKSLPVRIIENNSSAQKFPFRIEGSGNTVCSGETAGPTALDIIKNAKDICGFTYEIKESSFGSYLNKINSDEAAGMTGWLYLVNYQSPNVGAADYQLQAADSVLWYFGDFSWTPSRLSLSEKQISSGQETAITVETFNNNSWVPLPEATIHYNANTAAADSAGRATISPDDGFYKIYAEKQGYIRSNSDSLQVGQPSSSSIGLNVNIKKTNDKPDDSISFTVTPNTLDFGTMAPGTSSDKKITVANRGSSNIHVESIVSGDLVFTENIKLNNLEWKNFKTDIAKNNNEDINASLSIPADYAGEEGAKSGQLTIWAMAE